MKTKDILDKIRETRQNIKDNRDNSKDKDVVLEYQKKLDRRNTSNFGEMKEDQISDNDLKVAFGHRFVSNDKVEHNIGDAVNKDTRPDSYAQKDL
jgi:hypothetical protein